MLTLPASVNFAGVSLVLMMSMIRGFFPWTYIVTLLWGFMYTCVMLLESVSETTTLGGSRSLAFKRMFGF